MSRKKFIESHNASCSNWTWSWSFVNHEDKFVIFGAWDVLTEDSITLILDEEWRYSHKGREQPGYFQAREHIDLIINNGYKLKTFKLIHSDELEDSKGNGPAKIKSFDKVLQDRILKSKTGKWFAAPNVDNEKLNQSDNSTFKEGSKYSIVLDVRERNPKARKACLAHHGFSCSICEFNFEEFYGPIGKDYIHVHHIIPLSEINEEYEVDPINDLTPVCPNCHAMLHAESPVLLPQELKSKLSLK